MTTDILTPKIDIAAAYNSLTTEAQERYDRILENQARAKAPCYGPSGVVSEIMALNLCVGSRNGMHLDDEILEALTRAGVKPYQPPAQKPDATSTLPSSTIEVQGPTGIIPPNFNEQEFRASLSPAARSHYGTLLVAVAEANQHLQGPCGVMARIVTADVHDELTERLSTRFGLHEEQEILEALKASGIGIRTASGLQI